MGSYVGVMKVAARRIGMSYRAYMKRRAGGERWCTACRVWHPTAAFPKDADRFDGTAAKCRAAHNRIGRERYWNKRRETTCETQT